MEVRIARNSLELRVRDDHGRLSVEFHAPKPGSLKPEKRNGVCLKGEDIEFFAGMLLDPTVPNAHGNVDLKEPYPYILQVKWDDSHRTLSFFPWEEGGAIERIRLSPLEAWKIGKLAERTALINHLIRRLAMEG